MSVDKEYLSLKELVQCIPYKSQTIYNLLAKAGFPGWFERCREHAHSLYTHMAEFIGVRRVLWSAGGFANNPCKDDAPKIR